MDADVCFEAEGVDDGHEAPDAVEGRSGDGAVGENVPSSPRQNGVECGDGVGGSCHGDGVEGFEESW